MVRTFIIGAFPANIMPDANAGDKEKKALDGMPMRSRDIVRSRALPVRARTRRPQPRAAELHGPPPLVGVIEYRRI